MQTMRHTDATVLLASTSCSHGGHFTNQLAPPDHLIGDGFVTSTNPFTLFCHFWNDAVWLLCRVAGAGAAAA